MLSNTTAIIRDKDMKVTKYKDLFLCSLTDLAFTEKEKALLLRLGNEDTEEEILDMITAAEQIANPKAVFAVCSVEERQGKPTLNGISPNSAFVCDKLKDRHRAFPYVASCSGELDAFAAAYKGDALSEYWADAIKQVYLNRIMQALFAYMKKEYRIEGHFSALNPGSLADWPVNGQQELFAMLGGMEQVYEKIGVYYNESFLMFPNKSVSGIGFESEVFYENCQYCPIAGCPNRRATRIE